MKTKISNGNQPTMSFRESANLKTTEKPLKCKKWSKRYVGLIVQQHNAQEKTLATSAILGLKGCLYWANS